MQPLADITNTAKFPTEKEILKYDELVRKILKCREETSDEYSRLSRVGEAAQQMLRIGISEQENKETRLLKELGKLIHACHARRIFPVVRLDALTSRTTDGLPRHAVFTLRQPVFGFRTGFRKKAAGPLSVVQADFLGGISCMEPSKIYKDVFESVRRQAESYGKEARAHTAGEYSDVIFQCSLPEQLPSNVRKRIIEAGQGYGSFKEVKNFMIIAPAPVWKRQIRLSSKNMPIPQRVPSGQRIIVACDDANGKLGHLIATYSGR